MRILLIAQMVEVADLKIGVMCVIFIDNDIFYVIKDNFGVKLQF